MTSKQNERKNYPPRTAIYTRVSKLDRDEEDTSNEGQVSRCKAWAQAKGWSGGTVYTDSDKSGQQIRGRSAYQKMMYEIDTWDVMLVARLDRVHRNTKNFYEMIETLDNHGKKLVVVDMSLDTTTPVGELVMGILVLLATFESKQTGQRIRVSLHHRMETTDAPHGPAGFGHQRVGRTNEVIPEEGVALLRAVRILLDGGLPGTAATALNEAGFTTRRGVAWNTERVRDVVADPRIAGLRIYDEFKRIGRWSAIISLREYLGVLERLDDLSARYGNVTSERSRERDECRRRIKEFLGTPESNGIWDDPTWPGYTPRSIHD